MRNTRKQKVASSVMQSKHAKGAVLIASLIFLTVMTVLGVTGARNNVAQERMAGSYRYGVESLNAAESGITDAIAEINADKLFVGGYNDELGGNFMRTYTDADTGLVYEVIMIDDGDDADQTTDVNQIVLLLAQGTGPNRSVRTVEVAIDTPVIGTSKFELTKAILTGDDLIISGNPELSGSLQDVHSNANVELTGSTQMSGVVSAVGTVTGEPQTGGGTTESGAGVIEIPEINPSDFEVYVDYIFDSDGIVYDNNTGAEVGDGAFGGFTFTGVMWRTAQSDTDMVDGDLYFRGEYGNVDIASNPGKKIPWEVTILTDGWLDISGNPTLANYKDPNDPIGFQNLLFMSYSDIVIRGNYEQPPDTLQGIIAAREQIDFKGTPDILGAVIAQDASNDSDLATGNFVSGNASIRFDGIVGPWDDPANDNVFVERLYWRQLRLAKGVTPFDAFN
jgi:hypothetical protein